MKNFVKSFSWAVIALFTVRALGTQTEASTGAGSWAAV